MDNLNLSIRWIILTSICFISNNSIFAGNLNFERTSDSTARVIPRSRTTDGYQPGYYGEIIVPEYWLDYHVTEIAPLAFSEGDKKLGKSSPQSVVLPNSIRRIRYKAFSEDRKLEHVDLGKGVKTIEYAAFEYCDKLSSITIPGSVELFEITRVDHYVSSYNMMFYCCDNLYSIKFDYGEKELKWGMGKYGDLSFTNSNGKKVVPRNVVVNRDLLLNVSGYKHITFGSMVKTIDIASTDDLETITCYATNPPQIVNTFSYNQFTTMKVLVPNEAVEKYMEDVIWGNFWNIEGFNTYSNIDSISDSKEVSEIARYDINGNKVSNNYKGVVIVIYNDGTRKKQIFR